MQWGDDTRVPQWHILEVKTGRLALHLYEHGVSRWCRKTSGWQKLFIPRRQEYFPHCNWRMAHCNLISAIIQIDLPLMRVRQVWIYWLERKESLDWLYPPYVIINMTHYSTYVLIPGHEMLWHNTTSLPALDWIVALSSYGGKHLIFFSSPLVMEELLMCLDFCLI